MIPRGGLQDTTESESCKQQGQRAVGEGTRRDPKGCGGSRRTQRARRGTNWASAGEGAPACLARPWLNSGCTMAQCRDLENHHHEKLLEIAINILEKIVKGEMDEDLPDDVRSVIAGGGAGVQWAGPLVGGGVMGPAPRKA